MFAVNRYAVSHCRSRSDMTFDFQGNVSRVFVLIVLLCALVCSEVPELAKLMDDTSNDFITPICLSEEISIAVAAQVTATVIAPVSRVVPYPQSSGVQRQTRFTSSSRDMLLLCSTLRT